MGQTPSLFSYTGDETEADQFVGRNNCMCKTEGPTFFIHVR